MIELVSVKCICGQKYETIMNVNDGCYYDNFCSERCFIYYGKLHKLFVRKNKIYKLKSIINKKNE